MIAPIYISADLEAGVVLVRYRRLTDGTLIAEDHRIAPGATAGIDSQGDIVAIELLDVNEATLAAAAAYAHQRNLAFPRDLSRLLDAA
jgi:hypothetical protein